MPNFLSPGKSRKIVEKIPDFPEGVKTLVYGCIKRIFHIHIHIFLHSVQ